MTREEAKDLLDNLIGMVSDNQESDYDTALKMGIKALEQEDIMDKIRAEIKTKYDSIPWRNNEYDDGWVEALEWVLFDVIDKYKAESEDK